MHALNLYLLYFDCTSIDVHSFDCQSKFKSIDFSLCSFLDVTHFVSTESKFITDATLDCEKRGGDLAMFLDLYEWQNFTNNIANQYVYSLSIILKC